MKINLISFLAISLILSSCVSMKHSYRDLDVNPKGISVSTDYIADLDINFNKAIKGQTTRNHRSELQAKQEAYYNAIVENNIHVLVDPIYSVSSYKRLFKTVSTASVIGFGAIYENPRPAGSDQEATGGSGATVNDRLAQLERFSKINGVQKGLTEASYAVDTRNGCCDNQISGNNSGFGQTHLIHASENSKSLVDEFTRFLMITDEAASVVALQSSSIGFGTRSLSTGPSNGASSQDGLLKRTIGRLPIIRRFFR
jgi:hypothetical protein